MSTSAPLPLALRALGIAVDIAKKDGHPEADVKVDVVRQSAANVRFARNEITTSGESDETSIALGLALGKKHATASTNQTDEESLRGLVQRVLAMTKLSPEDPERMPFLGKQTYGAPPPAWDDALATMPPKDRAAVATRAIALADEAKVSVAGFFHRAAVQRAIATSAGLTAEHRMTSADYTVTARTPDGKGSGWRGRGAAARSAFDAEGLARVAIEKAKQSAGAKAIPPGKYTVILEPQAVYELLAFLVEEMNQRSADEGRSFFAGKVGQKLFADFVSLRSDAADPSTASAPFDDEGFPLAMHPWIVEGRVQKLDVSRYWAHKKNLEPTGRHRVFHLTGGKADSVDDLVKGTKRGLLVTRFWYNRMLEPQSIMVTGLTRDGVFLVEDGKIAGPVANFRYNESPVKMLKNVDAMTRETVRVVGSGIWHVPALRTHDFTMASASAAV